MIEFVVNGIPYTDYLRASLTLSVESMANDFTFTATSEGGFPPFKIGDAIEVNVNDVKRFSGFIEEISGSRAEGSHNVAYSGRDRTGDFIDSQVCNLDDIRPPIDLAGVIRALINNIQSDLTVVDNVTPAAFNRAEDIIDQQDGDLCLEIAMLYARKRQCLLSSTGDGNILITQSAPTESNETLQSVKGGDNNIINQSWSITTTSKFNRHIFKSQLDPRTINQAGSTSSANVVNQTGQSIDDDSRQSRQKVVVESTSFSSAQLLDLSKWDKQAARAKSVRFNCSIAGHLKSDGSQWQENELILVNSDAADIQRKMLISEITFEQGEGSPTMTRLSLVERDVYTIDDKITNKRLIGRQNESFK